MDTFGQRLHILRTRHGLRQTDLAEKIGVCSTHICRYERGLSQPSVHTLKRLSELFGVSNDYLLNGEQKETFEKEVSDEELAILFSKAQQLSAESRHTVKNLLTAFINQEKLKDLV